MINVPTSSTLAYSFRMWEVTPTRVRHALRQDPERNVSEYSEFRITWWYVMIYHITMYVPYLMHASTCLEARSYSSVYLDDFGNLTTSHPGCSPPQLFGSSNPVGVNDPRWSPGVMEPSWPCYLECSPYHRWKSANSTGGNQKDKNTWRFGGWFFFKMFFVVSQNEWPMLFGAWRFLISSGDDLLDVQ